MTTLKQSFLDTKTKINARYNKQYGFQEQCGTFICPVFFSGRLSRLTVQSPKQIEKLCQNESIHIEAPLSTQASEIGLLDPFAWFQHKYGLIHAVLKHLINTRERKVIRIRTSSDYIAHDTVMALLKELALKHTVEIEIAYAWGLKPETARFLLPSCPSEKRLLVAYKRLKTLKNLTVIKKELGA